MMQKLLIAQHSETMLNQMQHALHDEWEIHVCRDSYPVIDMMEYMKPEAMLLDLNLEPKDGISVLRDGQLFLPPVVVATTNYADDRIAETVAELGADALIRIPFQIDCLKELLLSLAENCKANSCNAVWHLRILGINPKHSGYRCLQVEIQLLVHDHNLLLKEIYPTVAKACGLNNVRCVERVTRTAINAGWKNRDPDIWRRYFPADKRPTVKEFITRIAEEL